MSVQSDREQLKKQYPGKTWARKVDKMSDAQVAAVLLRLKNNGKLK